MVLQLFHQANLRFLFHRFVRGTVFADAESIVTPHEFHGEFHQRRHANRRFHVVGEYKERAHCSQHAAVERNTDTNTSHGEFAHTGLEETAGEITAANHRRVLQEPIRFVRVAKIGRRNDHILHVRRKHRQTRRRSVARGSTRLLLDFIPGQFGQTTGKPICHFCGLFRLCHRPSLFLGAAFCDDLFEFLSTLRVEFLHFRTNHERVVGVSIEMAHRVEISVSAQRRTVRTAIAFVAGVVGATASLSHHRVTDDQRGACCLGIRRAKSCADLFRIIAVDLEHVPIPRAVFHGRILRNHISRFRGELNFVGVEEHDQVVQSEMARQTSGALRDLFLHAAVGNVSVDFFFLESRITGARIERFGSNGGTHGVGMSLSERSAGVFHSAFEVLLRVSRRHGAPLTKRFQFVEGETSDQCQLRIEHRRHVTRIEEETVAALPSGLRRVVSKKFAIKDVDEIGAPHGASGVS